MKNCRDHDGSPLRQKSITKILSYATIKHVQVFSHNVKHAYLRSDDQLSREIYLRPITKDFKYFEVHEGHLLNLLKPLSGNGDSGDYWGVTFDRNVKEDLRMKPADGDLPLYFKIASKGMHSKKFAKELLGNYVDGSLLVGNEEFQTLTMKTLQKFDSERRIWDNFDFFWMPHYFS